MNRSVMQSSYVQQMMAGYPNWGNINTMRPLTQQQPSAPFFFPQHILPTTSPPPSSSSSSSSSSSLPMPFWHENQELPHESWSQLLMGGQLAEEDKGSMKDYQPKKLETSWEDQVMHQISNALNVDVKQENCASAYGFGHASEEFQAGLPNWSRLAPVSSPQSCVTNFSNNMLDFCTKADGRRHLALDQSSECNSTPNGGATKKAKLQPSSQTTLKVRKEKLGDRITALHQLVSPFGKTDTASVLLETIGYIRFLQSQIEALSFPYLSSAGSGNMRHQQSVHAERNCIFPEHSDQQFLHDNTLKRKGVSEQDGHEEPKKDLRSRGLCLVPISCTIQVGSDNGADYWAPAAQGGSFQ